MTTATKTKPNQNRSEETSNSLSQGAELAEDLDRLAQAEQVERDRQQEERLRALRAVAEYD